MVLKLPCGTSDITGYVLENCPSTTTICDLIYPSVEFSPKSVSAKLV